MNFIRFFNDKNIYKADLKRISENLVQINAPLPDVDITAGFQLLTKEKNGKVFGNYKYFKTIYRFLDDGSVILSSDGSIYVPPVENENESEILDY